MIPALKAEFRKLLTVRSTYIIFLISFAVASALIGFWVFGYKNVENAQAHSGALLNSLLASVSVVGVFLSFVSVMLVGHEYRYNTIMYSLTSANSRSKFFAAKWLAMVLFALVFAGVIILLNWVLFYIGLGVHHITPIAQSVPMGSFWLRAVGSIIGSVSLAFLVTMLLRNLIGAISIVLVMPTTLEPVLGLLLKENTKYLPYTALGNLTQMGTKVGYIFSLRVVAAYVVALGVIAYLLFLKRDAN